MKHLSTLFCFYFTFLGILSAQSFIDSDVYPFTDSYSDIEFADFILPTSDGGYLLVGSIEYEGNPNDYDGRVVKIDANGNFEWDDHEGGPGLDYFYGAVELGGFYYVVGAETSVGELRPMIIRYSLTGSEGPKQTISSSGKMLTIEKTYGGRLFIGGFFYDGAPEEGNTTGYYWVLNTDAGYTPFGNLIEYASKVAKITQSPGGNYYIFGTTYDPAEGCQVFLGAAQNRIAANTSAGDVFARKVNSNLGVFFTDIIGGDTPDSFVDGIATPDDGYAVIGRTTCLAFNFGDETGPDNICNDNGNLDPYWLYRGTNTSSGGLSWQRTIYSATDPFVQDLRSRPFGLINSCTNDGFVVGNNVGGLAGDNLDLFQVTQNSENFLTSTFTGSSNDFYGRDLAVGLNNDIVASGYSYNSNRDFAFFQFSPEDNCNPVTTCICAEADAYLPDAYQCEIFDNYNLGNVTSQSSNWIHWPGSTGGAQIVDIDNNGDNQLILESETPANDILYLLNGDGFDNDINEGRHRFSWDMYVETGSTGYYSFQYNQSEVSNTGNSAFDVYFNEDGTGQIIQGENFEQFFTYPQGVTFKIAHIIDLEEDIMEFWLNHDFKMQLEYSEEAFNNSLDADIGAINFYAASNTGANFWIDNICIRTTGLTATCNDVGVFLIYDGEPVCTENGQVYADACDAGNNGLYALGEYGVCLTVCDFNAEVIGRNDLIGFDAALTLADELPPELYGAPCIEAFYGFDVPYPLFADIYVLENETAEDIFVGTTGDVQSFVFQCSGGVIVDGDCVDLDITQPPGIYYIVMLGTVTSGGGPTVYSIDVSPSSICEIDDQAPIFSCTNNSYTGQIPAFTTSVLSAAANESYANCYGGLRTYAGEEAVFQLQVDNASVFDVTFSTSSGQGGLFLFNSNCGTGCLNYAEAPNGGGQAVMSGLTLAAGNYYLAVDQELGADIGTFSININCEADNNNEGFGILFNNTDSSDCILEEDEEQDHQVIITIPSTDDFIVGQDLFIFNAAPGSGLSVLNNDSLAQAFNGETSLAFNLPEDLSTTGRCSFQEGDSLQLYIRHLNGFVATGIVQSMVFADEGEADVNANGTFVPGGTSVITEFDNTNYTIFAQVPTSIQLLQEGNQRSSYWQISTPWIATANQEWINIEVSDPLNSGLVVNGLGSSTVIVSALTPNNSYAIRRGQIVLQSDDGLMQQVIQVSQLGLCQTPELSAVGDATINICEGESAVLTLNPSPGPDSVYTYTWSNGIVDATSITVSPTIPSSYTVEVAQAMEGRCSAINSFTFNVTVSPIPDLPINNGNQIICSDQGEASLSVAVGNGETAHWYDAPIGGTLLLSNSTTFTTNVLGTYYVEAFNPATDCTSPTRTAVTLTVNSAISLTPNISNPILCIGDNVNLSAQITGGTGAVQYTWRRGTQVLSMANVFNYTGGIVGTETIALEVQSGACIATQNYFITTNSLPQITLTQPTESDCAIDLLSYTVDFSSSGQVQQPASGTLMNVGANMYEITGIPVNEDITITVVENGCEIAIPITSPTCVCEANIAPPEINAGITLIQVCATEADELPLLIATVSDSEIYTVNWYGNNNVLLRENSLTYQPTAGGTYSAQTQSIANSCTSDANTDITIEIIDEINLSLSTLDIVTCVGETISVSTNGTTGGVQPLTFTWLRNNNVIHTGPTFTEQVQTSGNSSVTLQVTDNAGLCMTNEVVNITAATVPQISLTSGLICSDDLTTYSFIVNSNGQSMTTDVLQAIITNNGNGDYIISNIPVQTSVVISAINTFNSATCENNINISAPNDCNCAAQNIDPPVVNNGLSLIQLCEIDAGSLPLLTATVSDEENFTVSWYNTDDVQVAEETLTFQPTQAGTYSAQTESLNNNCTSDVMTSITIELIPAITFNPDATNIDACVGETVVLLPNASGGEGQLSYSWLNNGEEVSSASAYVFPVSGAGNENFTLIVTDAQALCSATESFTVNGIENPEITLNSNLTCSEDLNSYGFQVQMTGEAISTNSLAAIIQNNGNGNYTISNIPVTESVTVTTTNILGATICTDDLDINPPGICNCEELNIPNANPIQAVYTICAGDPFPLLEIESVSDEYTVEWYTEASLGATPFLTNSLDYQSTEAGTVYVLLAHNTSPCTSNTFASISLVINELPNANAGLDLSACEGTLTQLDATQSNGTGNLSYQWTSATTLDDSGIATPTFTAGIDETFTLFVTDMNGCTATDDVDFQALALPEVSLSETSAILCFGENTGEIIVSPVSGALPFDYVWSNGTTSTNTIGNLLADTYSVTFTDANLCAAEAMITLTQPAAIIVTDEMIAIMDNNGVLTEGSIIIDVEGGVMPYNFQWMNGANDVVGMEQHLVSDTEGPYTVLVTDDNDCTFLTDMLDLGLIVGTDQAILTESALSIYPNPTTGQVHLHFNQPEHDQVTIKLIDMIGRTTWQRANLQLIEQDIDLNIKVLPPGTYWLMVQTSKKHYQLKLIKI